MAKQSRSKSALGGKKSKASSKPAPKVSKTVKAAIAAEVKKQVHRMHISKTANGKFLVDHEFKSELGEDPIESEQHAVDPEGLPAHVGEYLGLGGSVVPEPALPPPASSLPVLPSSGGLPLSPSRPGPPMLAGLPEPPPAAGGLPVVPERL